MKKIILVEDDESIRDIFEIVFTSDEYKFISLETAESILSNQVEALELFILDKQLSGSNGLDVCRFVKSHEKYKNVPVVMLSASPFIADLAERAGADDVIKKPFELDDLKDIVLKYISPV